MSDIPEGTIGYGAVVLPHLDEFQGFFVVDSDFVRQNAVLMQLTAMATMPGGAIGALQSVIVEGVITHNWTLVGAAALGLHGITRKPFFWIKATKEPGGTRTEMFQLAADNVNAARIEINALPFVVELKARLRVGMAKRKLNPAARTH